MRRRCAEAGCPNLLIEENLEGPDPSLADVYDVITSAVQGAWREVEKVAYVDVNPAHDSGLIRFAANIAYRLGTSIQVFKTVIDAETWMRAETEPRRQLPPRRSGQHPQS